MNSALSEIGTSLRKIGKKRQNEVFSQLGVKDLRSLYEQIGFGDRLAPLTARHLAQEYKENKSSEQSSLVIQGTEGMVMTYGNCCNPIPGDNVMGYMSSYTPLHCHQE